jgi:hypothetical protein
MNRLVKCFTLSAMVFAFLGFATATAALGAEIHVGAVEATPGSHAVVPVTLAGNTVKIMALTVPLKLPSANLTIDSVSFAGALLKPGMTPMVSIDNVAHTVRFSFFPSSGTPAISETAGLLASLHLTITSPAPDQTVTIDSLCQVEHQTPPILRIRPELADTSGTTVHVPEFTAGQVVVKNSMDAGDDGSLMPKVFALEQNFPNPFNPSTVISFSLPKQDMVSLKVFNILGQEVETLVDDVLSAGVHTVTWNADRTASGVYFYRLSFDGQVLTRKMTFLK